MQMQWKSEVNAFAVLAKEYYMRVIALRRLSLPDDINTLIKGAMLRCYTSQFSHLIYVFLRGLGFYHDSTACVHTLRNAFISLFRMLEFHSAFYIPQLVLSKTLAVPLHDKLRELATVQTEPQVRRFKSISRRCDNMYKQVFKKLGLSF